MANFDIAYPLTITGEGYYVSEAWWRAHKDTVSGETYMGVDRIQNPNWAGWAIIDQYKAAHGAIPYNTRLPLSLGLEPMVKAFTKAKFWDVFHGDKINSQGIANLICEMNYMSGSWGLQEVQKAINLLIAPKSIVVDGGIGNVSLGYINSLPVNDLYAKIYTVREMWYESKLAQGDKDAQGWMNRWAQLPSELNNMA